MDTRSIRLSLRAQPCILKSDSNEHCNLNDDPTKKHRCHSIKSNNSKMIIKDGHMLSVDLSMLQDRNIAEIPLHYQPLNFAYVDVKVCCNGLFFKYNSKNDTIILWNPSTMTHQNIHKIPKFKSPKGYCIGSYYVNGFGYDAVNDDYKLVGMPTIHHNYNSFRFYVVNIYSLKWDSWRRIEQVIPYKMMRRKVVHLLRVLCIGR
ncbi:hypothetical protein Leryth_025170 [Lithospermum erythrorhizon]|nr:hypothetical protein Leryth_025170 [Lithospermum erythrorhizon]